MNYIQLLIIMILSIKSRRRVNKMFTIICLQEMGKKELKTLIYL